MNSDNSQNESQNIQQGRYLLSLFGLSKDDDPFQKQHPILNANEEQEQIHEKLMKPLAQLCQSENYSDMDLLSVFETPDAAVINYFFQYSLTI